MKKQNGFTLIELIIVIVILGILAVTAAPKFIDIQGDAKASTLQGVKAALQGGAQLVYAKSAIAGYQGNSNDDDTNTTIDQVTIGSTDVQTEFGYPDADSMNANMLNGWVDIDVINDFDLAEADSDALVASGSFGISLKGDTITSSGAGEDCHVLYTTPIIEGDSPIITVNDTGC